jgi:hypothetical protein
MLMIRFGMRPWLTASNGQLDAAFRFAGWITGLPWLPFGGFVAGKASFEFCVPIIQGFFRGADSWPVIWVRVLSCG